MKRKSNDTLNTYTKSQLIEVVNALYDTIDEMEDQINNQYILLKHYTEDVPVEEMRDVLKKGIKEIY